MRYCFAIDSIVLRSGLAATVEDKAIARRRRVFFEGFAWLLVIARDEYGYFDLVEVPSRFSAQCPSRRQVGAQVAAGVTMGERGGTGAQFTVSSGLHAESRPMGATRITPYAAASRALLASIVLT